MKKIILASLVLSLGAAHFAATATAATQKLVPLEYKTKVSRTTQKSVQQAPALSYVCQVEVSPFSDQRNNKVTLGASWSEPLLPQGLDSWLETVRAKELVNKTSSWTGDRKLLVKPSVTRLYSYAESMNIHGVIALKVEYWLDGELVETKSYRGMGSKANMVGALGEYATALNYAVHEVAPDVLADMKKYCAQD